MTLYKLLFEVEFDKLKDEYEAKHGVIDTPNFYEYYLEVLRTKTPKQEDDELFITIEEVADVVTGDKYLDVFGYSRDKEDNEKYTISMTDWDIIVSWEYELGDYSTAELIFTLIDDITFYGTEDDMIKQREELIQLTKDIKSGKEELIKVNSIDELFKELKDDGE